MIRRVLVYGLLAGMIGAGGCAAIHRVFLARLVSFPEDTPILSVEWYEPKEVVKGGFDAPLASVAAAEADLDLAVLEEAAAWAREKNSVALVVLRHGRIAFERYFDGFTADRTTNSYSMAKTLLGLLIGVALDEGAIGAIDDSISRYVPEWADDERAAITLEDLLRMQSGLFYDNDRSDPFSDMVQVHLQDDLVPTILAMRRARAPGEQFEYNNLNSQLLALALERATGERYAEYLSSRLWKPLAARDAAVWLDREGGRAKAYCCVFATPRDWARVGELLRNDGRVGRRPVVPADWIARMKTPGPSTAWYGLHLWLHPGDDDVPSFFYLDGGRKQRVYVLPAAAAVIVRVGEQADGWDDTFLPRAVVRAVR